MVVRKSTIDGTREYALSLEVCNRSLGLFVRLGFQDSPRIFLFVSLSLSFFPASLSATGGHNEETKGGKGGFQSGPATPPENVCVRARARMRNVHFVGNTLTFTSDGSDIPL